MAKNLVNQYVWLVDTIYKARKITYEQICQKWLDQGRGDKRIPLRTFHNWKAAAEEMFNLSIGCECKGGFYYYYIANREEIQRGDIRSWLLNTLSVSNLLADNITIKDRILLEDVPSGEEFLSVILEAMKANTKLELTYRSYSRDESNTFEVHPYCVKLFKQRWYFVGFCPYYNKVMIYALDRIIFIERMDDEPFEMPNPDVFSA